MRPPPSHSTDPEREALCARVARRVMGWVSADVPWAYDGATTLWHTQAGDPLMTVFSWRPDRNDTQNMQVLDRMTDLGFELALAVRRDRVVARFILGTEAVARGEDPDRRIALLRAALEAVGARSKALRSGHDAAG